MGYLFYISSYLSFVFMIHKSWYLAILFFLISIFVFRKRPGINFCAKMDHLFRCDGALIANRDSFKISTFLKIRWPLLIVFLVAISFSKPATVIAKESGFFGEPKKTQNKWFRNVSQEEAQKMKHNKIEINKLDKKIQNNDSQSGKAGKEDKKLKLNTQWIHAQPYIVRDSDAIR